MIITTNDPVQTLVMICRFKECRGFRLGVADVINFMKQSLMAEGDAEERNLP
jgi:hypothetical protein